MKEYSERPRVWRFLMTVAVPVWKYFNVHADDCQVEGPCLIVSNHVSAWDPVFLTRCFRRKPVHYVASEHLFRNGLMSKILNYAVSPIARRKASGAADTGLTCLRRLRAGHNVGLFAEGEASWDGANIDIFPATGKMARTSGATLVTCRIEGAYLTVPRWTKKIRRGRINCRVVGVYPPEQLKKMKPDEITQLINRDIHEDAWERQKQEHVRFKAKNRAEGIETGYYICPSCRGIGTVKGEGDMVRCGCGFEVFYSEEGFLEPAEPFETLRQWNLWQEETFAAMDFEPGQLMFSDEGMSLRLLDDKHGQQQIDTGSLCQYPESLSCGEHSFKLDEINDMSMVKRNILLFTVGENYYEIRSENSCCMRKYIAAWKRFSAEK